MVTDWIYNNPTWLWGTVVVALFSGVACGGLFIFNRVVHVEVRRAHNEMAGFTIAVISVTYAVLLAFIAIATWESFTDAGVIVDREADFAGSIYRDTQGLPNDTGRAIRADMREYVQIVIDKEWPEQEAGKTPVQGWEPLRRVQTAIVKIQPSNLGAAVIQAELLRTLNELYRARSSRLAAVSGHIPSVIWWIILIGGGLTTGYTYLFGFHDFRMHLAMTAAVTVSLALVIVLIIALDWPFRGAVSISPDAFVKAQQSWNDLPYGKAN